MMEKARYFVYVLRLEGGALYTGYTADLNARLRKHRAGTASRCTRSFPPLEIAACWAVPAGRGAAMSVEAYIKGCTRAAKELLIGDPELLAPRYREHTGRECGARPVLPHPELSPADLPRAGT
jgi:putative endonuclease